MEEKATWSRWQSKAKDVFLVAYRYVNFVNSALSTDKMNQEIKEAALNTEEKSIPRK